MAIEATLQVAYRKLYGYWRLANLNNPSLALMRWHPYLVGCLKPGARFLKLPIPFLSQDTKEDTLYTNSSSGYRGEDVSLIKPAGIKRIVTLGGSSTYCTGLSDDQTWPFLLGKALGPGWEVINFGMPGYSTVENLIQTAFLLSDLSPDYAVYYEGWNDLRNAHFKTLKGDYSDFHGPSQYRHFNIDAWKFGEWSVIQFLVKTSLRKLWIEDPQIAPVPSDTAYTDKIDQRALSLYVRNLNSIIILCKYQNIIPVMVPQIMNYQQLTSPAPNGYMPFVRNKDIKTLMASYNEKMRELAHNQRAPFFAEALQGKFTENDFLDQGHFNKQGSEKFARLMADFLRANLPEPRPMN